VGKPLPKAGLKTLGKENKKNFAESQIGALDKENAKKKKNFAESQIGALGKEKKKAFAVK
jgi:hypothetical protein